MGWFGLVGLGQLVWVSWFELVLTSSSCFGLAFSGWLVGLRELDGFDGLGWIIWVGCFGLIHLC